MHGSREKIQDTASIAMRKSLRAINRKVCRADLISWMHGRHKTGKLEKACK